MKHWVTYPLVTHPSNPELVSKDALSRFVRTAEAAGFDGVGFTDHPAPSDKWLKAGGHDAKLHRLAVLAQRCPGVPAEAADEQLARHQCSRGPTRLPFRSTSRSSTRKK